MNLQSTGEQAPLLRILSRLPLARESKAIGYLVALALTGLGLVLRELVEPLLPAGYPFVTFFPMVIATAFLFGVGPGVVAALLCGGLSRYFFVAPTNSFALTGGAGMAMALYAFVVCVDIALVALMQRAFRQLERERAYGQALADHREVLFRELQHRVGNNLQMVGALLNLQKRKITDPAAQAAIADAVHRLTLIGRIQRDLYGMSDAYSGLDGFLQQIVCDLVDSAGRADLTVEISGGEGLSLHPDDAIPVALIVAEAVSNAIEHGFAQCSSGRIAVRITEAAGELVIAVENDGHPLAEGFDAAASGRLGLRLARNLAVGRKGAFVLERGEAGTIARVTLPRPA